MTNSINKLPDQLCYDGIEFRQRIAGDEEILERAANGTLFPEDHFASILSKYGMRLPKRK